MRNKYGIGLFILTIAIMIGLSFVFRISNKHVKNESKQEIKTEAQKNTENCYYIKEKDGYVIVYKGDLETIYEYTSILVEHLPAEIQESVKKGIKVKSLNQIYGFLENYSS